MLARRRRQRLAYSTAPLVLLLTPLPSVAAEAADGPTALQEVVVTARKREENLQKVPVAITAVDDSVIRERSLTQLEDVQDVAPNVLFGESTGQPGSSRVYIRGIGENLVIYTADPAVGIYVDGIPLSRPAGSNVNLFDAERVEVLRGPQGTTFGKNTIGGAVNFVTKRPSDEREAYVWGRLGNYQRRDLRAMVNVPVAETTALRLIAGINSREGFVKNLYDGQHLDDEDSWELRGMLRFKPAESLEFLLSADYFRAREASNAPQLVGADPTLPGSLVGLVDSVTRARYGVVAANSLDSAPFKGVYTGTRPVVPGGPSVLGLQTRTDIDPLTNTRDSWGIYLIGDWDLSDALTIRSLTSYRDIETASQFDSFGTIVPISPTFFEENSVEFSHEFQLVGSGLIDGRLDFVAGLFYGVQKSVEQGDQFFVPELVSLLNLSTGRDQDQKTTSIAGFANLNYAITDKLEATLGARWTRDKKHYTRFEYAAIPTGTVTGFGVAARFPRPDIVFDLERSWSAWSGTAALQYQWNRDVMTYASWSRGFRSGGFSGFARSALEVAPYDPEYADVFELGLRSTWLDNKVVFNLTGFLTKYRDQQLLSLFSNFTSNPPVTGFRIQNAGRSELRGVELEAQLHPVDGWDVSLAYGLTDAEYTHLDSPIVPGSTSVASDLDKAFINVPKHTLNIGTTYTFSVPAMRGDVSLHADYSYRSKVYFDIQNTESVAQDAYGVFNARASWTSEDGTLEVAAWGRNLDDKRYITWGVFAAGYSSAYFGEPRTYGVEITKRW